MGSTEVLVEIGLEGNIVSKLKCDTRRYMMACRETITCLV